MALLSNMWLLVLQENSGYRHFFCGTLIMSRVTISYVFHYTFNFSILFRMFLILHAEKGLLVQGQPNLRMFNQLFWIAVFTFITLAYVAFPLPFLVKGSFPESSNAGKICLLSNIKVENLKDMDNYKFELMQFNGFFVTMCLFKYASYKVSRFVKGCCPRKKMSCIGVYKRNIMTFFETSIWLDIMYVFHYINPIFMAFIKVQGHSLTNESIFWAWNLRGIGGTFCLYFVLPFCITFPGECKLPETHPIFYVRKPEVLLPRSNSVAGENISFAKLQL